MEKSLNQESLKHYNQDIFAKTAISTLAHIAEDLDEKQAFKILFNTKNILLNKYKYNIVVKNAIDYFFHKLHNINIKEETKQKYYSFLEYIENSNKRISQAGFKKVKDDSQIFVHSINNQVYEILKLASNNKKFKLNFVEHKPFEMDKAFGKKLKEQKISYEIYPDLSLRQAIQNSDTCFIGGEAIFNNKGAMVKHGGKLAAEIAHKNQIPVYLCTHMWKHDHDDTFFLKLSRDEKVRKNYEMIPPNNITAYITDMGIHKPKEIVDEIKFHTRFL